MLKSGLIETFSATEAHDFVGVLRCPALGRLSRWFWRVGIGAAVVATPSQRQRPHHCEGTGSRQLPAVKGSRVWLVPRSVTALESQMPLARVLPRLLERAVMACGEKEWARVSSLASLKTGEGKFEFRLSENWPGVTHEACGGMRVVYGP
jgi:hypothetical protein